jgi:hypothetical protein
MINLVKHQSIERFVMNCDKYGVKKASHMLKVLVPVAQQLLAVGMKEIASI